MAGSAFRNFQRAAAIGQRLQPMVSLDPELRLQWSQAVWIDRVSKLGQYATGPSKWSKLKLDDPKTIERLERKERGFDKHILPVIMPHLSPQSSMLVVGFGPGRRLAHYLQATKGKCYGIDFLDEMVGFAHQRLTSEGWGRVTEQFVFGIATDLNANHAKGSKNMVTWERLGNHLVDDEDWLKGLDEAVSILRPDGKFFLAESVSDLNPGRQMNPGSKFRPFSDYITTLHSRGVSLLSAKETRFAGDGYILAVFGKTASGC